MFIVHGAKMLDSLNPSHGYSGITQNLDLRKDDTGVREMLNILYLYFCSGIEHKIERSTCRQSPYKTDSRRLGLRLSLPF